MRDASRAPAILPPRTKCWRANTTERTKGATLKAGELLEKLPEKERPRAAAVIEAGRLPPSFVRAIVHNSGRDPVRLGGQVWGMIDRNHVFRADQALCSCLTCTRGSWKDGSIKMQVVFA
jgi:hypothetical protein